MIESSSDVQRFRVTQMSELPTIPAHKEKTWVTICMPHQDHPWRNRLWRLLPRPLRRCGCCYHRVDWVVVNTIALRLFREAAQVSRDYEYVRERACENLSLDDLDEPTSRAVESLFKNPLEVGLDGKGETTLSNGRHRTIAMRDARIPATVALHWEPPA
ncbi:hypothetical protein [Amycolatopsis sp. cmx-4-68]|uniref:hypothetical protein n=1 Tax=Amycolatopsis sp. cmx-4-68 TaxID=2790938 RepID=UPI003979FF0C